MPVLLVLKPFAFVFFSVREFIHAVSLAFAFHVFAFIRVSVFEVGDALAVRFAFEQLPLVFRTVFKSIIPYFDFLGVALQDRP